MLAFLHTLPAMADRFAALLAELEPAVPARHLVDESLLASARAARAVTPEVRRRVEGAVERLVEEGARVVVCTCSTIGAAAEEARVPPRAAVMRIDRPMAERAVSQGR